MSTWMNASSIVNMNHNNMRKAEAEELMYQEIKKNLDKIIEEGRNKTIWLISEPIEGDLPEYKGILFKNSKKYFKKPKESPRDYLTSVLTKTITSGILYYPDETPFLYYREGNTLIADAKWEDLQLHFDVKEVKTTTEKEKVTLFRPAYTTHEKIEAELEIRTKILEITYKKYQKGESQTKEVQLIRPPTEII